MDGAVTITLCFSSRRTSGMTSEALLQERHCTASIQRKALELRNGQEAVQEALGSIGIDLEEWKGQDDGNRIYFACFFLLLN
jgi:hypothetical protein